MNCLKCGGVLNTSLRCLYCGTQYSLREESVTAETNIGIEIPYHLSGTVVIKNDVPIILEAGYIPIGTVDKPLNAYTYNGHMKSI